MDRMGNGLGRSMVVEDQTFFVKKCRAGSWTRLYVPYCLVWEKGSASGAESQERNGWSKFTKAWEAKLMELTWAILRDSPHISAHWECQSLYTPHNQAKVWAGGLFNMFHKILHWNFGKSFPIWTKNFQMSHGIKITCFPLYCLIGMLMSWFLRIPI